MAESSLGFKGRCLRAGLRCLSWLPLRAGWRLSGGVARLLVALNSRSALVTDENLRLCHPELDTGARRQLTLASLQHTTFMLFELSRVWTWPWRKLAPLVQTEVEGLELLEAAKADGRGLVVLGPHIGNWEMLSYYLQTHKPLVALYQPVNSRALNELVLQCRQHHGSTLLPTDRRGVMGLFKALKAGGWTGILPDQVPDQGGAFAPFFGTPAYTMTLVHNLIQRTGCRVLMGACLRMTEPGAARFRLVFAEPDPAIYADDEAQSLAALNRSVEQVTTWAPAQYQWEYKRFRRLQPGEAKRYQFGNRR